MDKKQTRKTVSVLFAAVVAITAFQNGSGIVVSLGAGILGGAAYYLISRFVIDSLF